MSQYRCCVPLPATLAGLPTADSAGAVMTLLCACAGLGARTAAARTANLASTHFSVCGLSFIDNIVLGLFELITSVEVTDFLLLGFYCMAQLSGSRLSVLVVTGSNPVALLLVLNT